VKVSAAVARASVLKRYWVNCALVFIFVGFLAGQSINRAGQRMSSNLTIRLSGIHARLGIPFLLLQRRYWIHGEPEEDSQHVHRSGDVEDETPVTGGLHDMAGDKIGERKRPALPISLSLRFRSREISGAVCEMPTRSMYWMIASVTANTITQ
jgi:hypothetical protein